MKGARGIYLNIINVTGDGNCGLYASLLGLYLQDREAYNNWVSKTSKISPNPNFAFRKLLCNNINQNNVLRNNLRQNKKYFMNTHFMEKGRKILGKNIKSIQSRGIHGVENFLNFQIFYPPDSELSPGMINLDDIIIMNTTDIGVRHFKLIYLSRNKLGEGGGAAAPDINHDPRLLSYIKNKLKEQIKNKSEFGNMLRSSINSLTAKQLFEKAVEDRLILPNPFVRNANMTAQPKQEELTNASRTKMKEFLKSKIPNSNKNKNVKNNSINVMKDENLFSENNLKQYLIEKETENFMKSVILDYNHKQLLRAFKQKELDETGGAAAAASNAQSNNQLNQFLRNANRQQQEEAGGVGKKKNISNMTDNEQTRLAIQMSLQNRGKKKNEKKKTNMTDNEQTRLALQMSLQNRGKKKNEKKSSRCIISGGTSFVYVSKIGRRKLRYTKTGRKFIINKGKRKYLK